jgi:CheY-like chemotaxis protein
MSQDNVKKLFSSYTHIEFEGRQKMNPTGVGLGLNIASNLAELLAPVGQQGINVVSVPGQGSIFSFILENKDVSPHQLESQNISLEVADELPGGLRPRLSSKVQKDNTSTSATQFTAFKVFDPEPRNEVCSCPKILVVDDNPFNTMAFETILSSLDMKCDSVYNGKSAIQKILDRQGKACGSKDCKPYLVVFMDQEMPEMSGAETVIEIKKLQREGLVPLGMEIIGCTAHQSKQEVDKFLEAGLDQCIHKPISTFMIQNILKGSLY